MSNVQERYDILAKYLELVANDLKQYAEALRNGDSDWRPEWNTYSLEAQQAVYNLLEADGVMPAEIL